MLLIFHESLIKHFKPPPDTVGVVLVSITAYFLPHWKHLVLGISMIGVPILSFFIWLPECPRWLHCKGKTEEANKILESIAKGTFDIHKRKEMFIKEKRCLFIPKCTASKLIPAIPGIKHCGFGRNIQTNK